MVEPGLLAVSGVVWGRKERDSARRTLAYLYLKQ